MQGTRQITYGSVNSTNGAPDPIFSAAVTWGELKKEHSAISLAASGMSAIVGGENTKLTVDSQKLPEGDFQLYFVLEKNNSGNGIN